MGLNSGIVIRIVALGKFHELTGDLGIRPFNYYLCTIRAP